MRSSFYSRLFPVSLVCSVSFASLACKQDEKIALEAEAPSAAKADPELDKLSNEQLVRKIMELTGAAQVGQQVMDAMLGSMGADPNLPPGFIEKFKQNAKPEALVDLIVPIYLTHFSREDLIASIHFYQTPAGQRMIKETPAVMNEAMQAGQRWGMGLAQKTMADLQGGGVAAPNNAAVPR